MEQHFIFMEKELNKANNRIIFLEIILAFLIVGFLAVGVITVPAVFKSTKIIDSVYSSMFPSEANFSSGEGDTWEAAIEDAERNLKEKRGY